MPAFFTANGSPSKPVPMFPFKRCIKVWNHLKGGKKVSKSNLTQGFPKQVELVGTFRILHRVPTNHNTAAEECGDSHQFGEDAGQASSPKEAATQKAATQKEQTQRWCLLDSFKTSASQTRWRKARVGSLLWKEIALSKKKKKKGIKIPIGRHHGAHRNHAGDHWSSPLKETCQPLSSCQLSPRKQTPASFQAEDEFQKYSETDFS